MLKGTGKLLLQKDQAIKLIMNQDLIAYYSWLISRRFYALNGSDVIFNDILSSPMHGSHITIINRKHHGWNSKWNTLINPWIGKTFEFLYDPEQIQVGGPQRKGFWNFWMPVKFSDPEQIEKMFNLFGIKCQTNDNFMGFHFTVNSSKNYMKNQIK